MGVPSTVVDAARMLRDGDLSSAELTAALLDRADVLDPVLGVYVARYDQTALEAAARADRELAAGVDRGPLHGIPVAIKDILASVEGPTTAQSLVLDRGWGAGRDAPAVARLREAGAVITGKVTTMEFASGVPDPTKPFPLPRNPWDLTTWPGGSSSGTGVGVAAGLFLGGLRIDKSNSIRLPSAFCGVTGLMPTFGRVPKSGCVPLGYSQDHVGPMARTARDCGLILQAIAGYHPSDPDCADAPVPDMAAGLGGARPDAPLAGLRVGVVREHHFPEATDPAVVPAFDDALATLGQLGADLTEVALPRYAEMLAVNLVTTLAEAFSYHRADLGRRWADYGLGTRLFVAQGSMVSGADYVQAQRVRRLVQRQLAGLFTTVDLVVTPTASVAAPAYDSLGQLEGLFGVVHTPYWDPAGNPVLVMPMGFTTAGLPLSVQLAAAPFAEPLLVAVGDAFQGATEWHRRVPPLLSGPVDVSVDDLPRPTGEVGVPASAPPEETVAV